eukprot:CAMPEP_0194439218 /NCGR_PEP_ID=MMETSP0176-20130528/109327_1 /TAXON_ID=216777 /ORGANISM="Proboscia alata, Strain PI-D3" /LENGTH=131 /DNA_ID=CAMNT_0039262213 /DNA_START=225 /DNA_END=617 /DNA_ORIENTATION=+
MSSRTGDEPPTTRYPFTRTEECSWHTEQAAVHLASLLGDSTSGIPPLPFGTGGPFHSPSSFDADDRARSSSFEITPNGTRTTIRIQKTPFLLTRGWNDAQVVEMRTNFGANVIGPSSKPTHTTFLQKLHAW